MRTGAAPLIVRAAVLLLTLLFVPGNAPASHATFDYAFDRVEIDGNTFGPFDGNPDFVDEFSAGGVTPWSPTGTVLESGGALRILTPGTYIPGFGQEISSAGIGGFSQGAGNFTFTARVTMVVPPMNSYVAIVLGGGLNEDFQIVVVRDQVVQNYFDFITSTSETQVYPISSSDITSDIILRISFDDALNLASAAFSLNGGVTFQRPFIAHTFNVIATGGFSLLAGQVYCGDGVIDSVAEEACDDGNLSTGDGCDSACAVEPGFRCRGEPSVCTLSRECVADVDCSDGNACTRDRCDADTSMCIQENIGASCADDGNACTQTTCAPATGCTQQPVADGVSCTRSEGCILGECLSGVCVESPVCAPVTVAVVQVVPRRASNPKLQVTCSGEKNDICQAEGSFEPDVDSAPVIALDAASAAETKKVDCSSVSRGTLITASVRRKVKRTGQAKLKLKLNPIGKCLLKNAGEDGIGVRVTTRLQRRGETAPTLLDHLVRVVRRAS